PTEADLMGPGRQSFTTTLGDIDFYGEIDEGRTYIDLGTRAITMEVGEMEPAEGGVGLRVKVLGLEEIIAVKERALRPKDVAALPMLRATLEEKRAVRRR